MIKKSDFTLKQLRTFVLAAQNLSFAKTAEHLGISQPAVSDHIQALEEHLGYRLFIRRKGTTPVLTDGGIALLARAELLLNESEQIVAASPNSPTSKVTTFLVYCDWHLRENIRREMSQFLQQHPNIGLDLLPSCHIDQIANEIARGHLDIAIVTLPKSMPLWRSGDIIGEVPQSIFASDRFLKHQQAAGKEISELPFIAPMPHSWEERALYEVLQDVGVTPHNVVARAQYPDTVVTMAESGLGLVTAMDELIALYGHGTKLNRIGPKLPTLYRTLFRRKSDNRPELKLAEQFLLSVIEKTVKKTNKHT